MGLVRAGGRAARLPCRGLSTRATSWVAAPAPTASSAVHAKALAEGAGEREAGVAVVDWLIAETLVGVPASGEVGDPAASALKATTALEEGG